jgi:hypothetical protein
MPFQPPTGDPYWRLTREQAAAARRRWAYQTLLAAWVGQLPGERWEGTAGRLVAEWRLVEDALGDRDVSSRAWYSDRTAVRLLEEHLPPPWRVLTRRTPHARLIVVCRGKGGPVGAGAAAPETTQTGRDG